MSKEYLEYIIATVIADHGLTDAAEVKKYGVYGNLNVAAGFCCTYSRDHLAEIGAGCHRNGLDCVGCGVDFEKHDEITWEGLHEELLIMQRLDKDRG